MRCHLLANLLLVQLRLQPKTYCPKKLMVLLTVFGGLPEHAMTFSRDDYQKSDIRRKIQEVTKRKRSELAVSGPSG